MVRERLVPVQERTLFLVKAILRTLPIRRPWIRQSLAPRRSCIVWPLLAKQYVFSLFVQVRSLRKENMCLMVKAVTQTAPDAEIGWSRRRHASRRRSGGVSPQIGTRSGGPTFSFRQVDESDKFIHFEHDSVDGTGARPKIRENEEYASGNFAAVAPANATEQDTVARSTRQRGSSSFEGIEDWVRALPSTTVQLTNRIPNIQIPGRMGGIDVQSMPRAFEDMRVPGLLDERRMNDPARNVRQSRNPLVQESPQVTRLGVSEIMPRSYEEVGDSIN